MYHDISIHDFITIRFHWKTINDNYCPALSHSIAFFRLYNTTVNKPNYHLIKMLKRQGTHTWVKPAMITPLPLVFFFLQKYWSPSSELKPSAWSCLPEVSNPDGPAGAMRCSNFSTRAISLWRLQQTSLKRRPQTTARTNPQLENPLLPITVPPLRTNHRPLTRHISIFSVFPIKIRCLKTSLPVPFDLYFSCMQDLWFLF